MGGRDRHASGRHLAVKYSRQRLLCAFLVGAKALDRLSQRVLWSIPKISFGVMNHGIARVCNLSIKFVTSGEERLHVGFPVRWVVAVRTLHE